MTTDRPSPVGRSTTSFSTSGCSPIVVGSSNSGKHTVPTLQSPIAAGDYSHLGFGTAFTFSVGDTWWVQPNFPGWMVLSGLDSGGPGDRGVVFRSGVNGLMPMLRSGPAGDVISFDLEAISASPPESLTVIDSGAVEVGGATGARMRFMFDATADCAAGAVCEYWLMTRFPYPPASMRTGYEYELLHLDDGLAEPLTTLIETYDDRWFDRAQELLDTIEFEAAG